MIERITPASQTPQGFFRDERFQRFRRTDIPFIHSKLELPDPEALLEEGKEKAALLKGKKAQQCLQTYILAARSLQEAMTAIGSITDYTEDIFEKMSNAREAYRRAGLYLDEVNVLVGKKIDKKV